jgi:hypothetical protein
VDKYSDIDLFLCVDDSKVHETFLEIEKELLKIGRLDFKSAILNEENQKIKFFHIE